MSEVVQSFTNETSDRLFEAVERVQKDIDDAKECNETIKNSSTVINESTERIFKNATDVKNFANSLGRLVFPVPLIPSRIDMLDIFRPARNRRIVTKS